MSYRLTQFFAGACLSVILATTAHATQSTASSEYRQGTNAFREGNFEQALEHFEAARNMGQETPGLVYNMAVTHYKLNNLDEAEVLFEELANRYPDWRDLGRYNLGRIAMRRGNDDQAAKYFRLVQRTASNDELVYLAGEGLRSLDVSAKPVQRDTGRKSFFLANLAAGVDDNVIAFPDQLQQSSSRGEDSFLEFLGYGQQYLTGNQNHGVQVHGFIYSRRYNELDVMDLNMISLGLDRDTSFNRWSVRYGLGAGYSEVDGEELTTQIKGNLKIGRRAGRHEYSARYQPIHHNGGSNFSQLDGWEHRLDLTWRYRVGNGRWTVRYRLEANDRDDLTSNGTFLSYSPLRNGLMIQGEWYATANLTLVAGGEYVDSHYDDKNSLTDIDGVFKTAERDSDEVKLWLRGEYAFHPRWRLIAEYRYAERDDEFLLYEYDRNEAKLSIEYSH